MVKASLADILYQTIITEVVVHYYMAKGPYYLNYLSKISKFSCLELDFCCFVSYNASFCYQFSPKWRWNNFNELSVWKGFHRYAWINHSQHDFRYFELWQFLALFGYFWDWKWLRDNTANFWWLDSCWKHIIC